MILRAGLAHAEYCSLYVRTEPPGADVFINGSYFSKSPFSYQPNHPAQIRVKIVKKGYQTWEKEVSIGLNQVQALHVELLPAKRR